MSTAETEKILSLVIAPEDAGRMIKHIANVRLGLSHKQFTSAKFRENGILLDGHRALATDVVQPGQVLTVSLRRALLQEHLLALPDAQCSGPVDVVFEDDDLYVICKQAPLPTQSSIHQKENDTLEARMYRLLNGRAFRPINRLDKGTSGLMLVAKHAPSQAIMQKALHSEAFVREYLAIVEGMPPQAEGCVDAPIAKADGATIRRVVDAGGKAARTHYVTCKTVQNAHGTLTLLRLRLESGRTHQIRVHMQHIGCPVFGDFLYGTERDELPCRFALHSTYVQFVHPTTGKEMSFTAPLPEELQRLIDA